MVFRHNILQLPEGCTHTERKREGRERGTHTDTWNGRLLCRLVEAKTFRSQLIFPVNCTDDNKSKGERKRGRKRERDDALAGKSPKKSKLKVKLNVSSAVCVACVCVCVCAFCLPCLIMRLHAHKDKSQTGDTHTHTDSKPFEPWPKPKQNAKHATQPFFCIMFIIIFIFYLFTCAFW